MRQIMNEIRRVSKMLDIEEVVGTKKDYNLQISSEFYEKIRKFLVDDKISLQRPWGLIEQDFRDRYHDVISKKALRYVYEKEISASFPQTLVKRMMRSEHGVFVVSVVTSPYPKYIDENGQMKQQRFSCLHNCVFCPTQPNYPKSYLEGEPGVDRAYSVEYDVVKQIHIRLDSYLRMGQIPDKLEIIVLGGTWSEYPKAYRDNVILDIYYGVNTYKVKREMEERYGVKEGDKGDKGDKDKDDSRTFEDSTTREKLTLRDEITLNETNDIHVIGLTLETRPDSIDMEEIQTFREYNCTRVQLGVQHTNNEILKTIKRGHYIEDSMRAIKLLLDNGFKVDIHLMPNLPGSSLDEDKAMIHTMLTDTRLRADQWKVYPTSVVPWSILERWFKQGKYQPYGDDSLLEFLLDMKSKIPEWIRLNRIVRDIPKHHINGGCETPHMRQLLHVEMKKRNIVCHCIRCRSVKSNTSFKMDGSDSFTKIETYESSGGIEHFISHVSTDNSTLFGFARLRIPDEDANDANEVLDEIKDCALIRELHVYGSVSIVQSKKNGNCNLDDQGKTQHRGIGKLLMAKAEEIAIENGYEKIAVISGVGVREYYRKLGYDLASSYMVKQLNVCPGL